MHHELAICHFCELVGSFSAPRCITWETVRQREGGKMRGEPGSNSNVQGGCVYTRRPADSFLDCQFLGPINFGLRSKIANFVSR